MSANSRQVAGNHYSGQIQHWDYVWSNELDYFQGQITKYVTRWKKKNGMQDLRKAQHFLEKYIELVGEGSGTNDNITWVPVKTGLFDESGEPTSGYVNQD